MAFTKFHLNFFQRAIMLQGEIIPKMRLLYFLEESIHEVSRRYFIPEYHSCKISGSKILNNSKNIILFFFSIFHHPTADTSFKFLVLFKIRHLQKFIPLLAHLSQMLIGELIGFSKSGVHPSSSVVVHNAQRSSPKPNFMWSLLG